MTEKRKKAIVRRRIFISLCVTILVASITVITTVVVLVKNALDREPQQNLSSEAVLSSQEIPSSETSDNEKPNISSDLSQSDDLPSTFTTPTGVVLDTNFSRLLLINGDNPLPDDYDTKVREYLVEIDDEYRNNDYVTQIHRDVYPYIAAMVAAAQADGVDLQVWSPFRSYAIQNDLFQKQVARVGGDEEKAATVVARPGTSEHNTGLCADFNMADDAFENTEMYRWMCENAEDYGFILRYPQEKQHITGVIYESWHWRFVGINNAKLINELGVTLEEFIEMREIDPTIDMYGDDSAKDADEQIID